MAGEHFSPSPAKSWTPSKLLPLLIILIGVIVEFVLLKSSTGIVQPIIHDTSGFVQIPHSALQHTVPFEHVTLPHGIELIGSRLKHFFLWQPSPILEQILQLLLQQNSPTEHVFLLHDAVDVVGFFFGFLRGFLVGFSVTCLRKHLFPRHILIGHGALMQ
jgi:hypothetical protein